MKAKNLYLLASAVLLSFASCTNDMQEVELEQPQLLKQIVMTTEDFQPETGSRTLYQIADGAVKCTWAANDTVGVFPNEGMQTSFPMISGAGTKNATFNGGGWALKDGSTYSAYYPFIGNMYLDRNAVPVSYAGQTQAGNGSMAHLGAYDYMVATPVAPEFGSAKFMFKHLSALVQLKLTISQPATLTSVKLVAETKAFAVNGTVDIMADAPSIVSKNPVSEVELVLQDVKTTEADQVVTLYMMLPPADLSAQTLKAVIVSDKGTQEIALESKNFQAGKAYGLSEKKESIDVGYKNGVVTLAEAGTMKQLLGDDYLNITSLKVVGPINGDDVLCLRQMLGGNIDGGKTGKGELTTLDLSNASIVKGGGWYYRDLYSHKYYTSNDEMGMYMFNGCPNLKEMVLPDGVTSISPFAFQDCSALTSVTIGDGVTYIGDDAFRYCSAALTTVYIKDLSAWCRITFASASSTPMCYGAKLYLDNKEITELVIPEDITEIKEYAFKGCKSIVNVVIPDKITSLGISAFSDCDALTSVTIGDGVTSLSASAFGGCDALTSIEIPDNVTSIDDKAFLSCNTLASVTIGAGVTSIGENAFSHCNALTSIEIPDNVTSISDGAFSYCETLTIVTVGDGGTSIGDDAFRYFEALTTITIGNGGTSIGDYAFYDCSALTIVTIGSGVTSIGDYAFRYCEALTDFYCHATTPPSIGTLYARFPYYGKKTTLHVPLSCSKAYNSTAWGVFFKNIVEME